MSVDWLTRFGGYGLLAIGGVLFSVIIPSAAGPADVLPQQRLEVPAALTGNRSFSAPLLISAGSAVAPLSPPAAVSASPALPVPTTEVQTVAAAPEAPPETEITLQAPQTVLSPPLPPTNRIVVPRLGLDIKVIDVGVLPNGEMEAAAYAAGRLSFSAEAGEQGNVVLAGHNDILGEVFRRLPELIVGEELVLFRGDHQFRYRVEGRTIVREQGASDAQRSENARWMDPTDDAVATLISCYPYRVDTHRYIVRARLVS